MIRRLICCIFAALLMAMPGTPRAQEALRIAAVVNDQVISVYDLEMRLTLVIVFSGLPNSLEARRRLAPQVLRTLIDDELKRQEAKRIKLTYTVEEVDRVIRRLEKSSKLPKGGLEDYLAQRNVEISVLANQISADIAWKELVNGRYGRSINVSDEEIDEVLAEINSNEGKPEYRVSEIFLPVDKPENDAEIAALANRMVEQVRGGANFAALARNFSKSPSAEKGGDLGWNRIGRLDEELDNALVQLQPGQLSPPIRTPDGYYILALMDQRTARKFGQPDPGPATINLQQLFVPVAEGAAPAVIDAAMNTARQAGQQARNCEDLDQAAKKFGSPLSGNMGDIKTSALGQRQRVLIQGLAVMTASQPLRMPDGVMVLMVCRRDEVKVTAISVENQRNLVTSNLYNDRLAIFARQYIRDLRRQAFVEVRE